MDSKTNKEIFKINGLLGVYSRCTVDAFVSADKHNWKSALFASRIVGKYDRGATIGLANDSGVSVDTIEDRAHAYMMFERLCKLQKGKYRLFVFQARRLPYIYYSHFRALWDQKAARDLTDSQVLDLLMDIVQAEGDLSTRKLERHIDEKYGDLKSWEYYVEKTMKDVHNALQHPELPDTIREKLTEVYEVIGE